MSVQLGKRGPSDQWHIFVWGYGPSLCWNGMRLWHCVQTVELQAPEDAERIDGEVCNECLRELVRVAKIAEALNARK